ncbi:type II toxin-antitoxin system PemK/MazF family toxin [Candidatus Woesearchaeota archaeon]|nr:type II toxin-antitoxin system PemK/MazF family toxin [Candidatus Woesearchaeota archaeon]
MYNAGDVVLTRIQFADTFEIKKRPAVILYTDFGNLVVAGITSNKLMRGISLTKKDGAVKESVIKTNYIFTISTNLVLKKLFHISKEKKKLVYNELTKRLKSLIL